MVVKQITLTKVEGGYLFQRQPGGASVHPNFGHALKSMREYFDELKGAPKGPEQAQVAVVEE